MVSRVTPPEASSGTRRATSCTAARNLAGSILSRKQAIGARCKRRLNLLDRIDLDLHLEARHGSLRATNRFDNSTASRDMIVLD